MTRFIRGAAAATTEPRQWPCPDGPAQMWGRRRSIDVLAPRNATSTGRNNRRPAQAATVAKALGGDRQLARNVMRTGGFCGLGEEYNSGLKIFLVPGLPRRRRLLDRTGRS